MAGKPGLTVRDTDLNGEPVAWRYRDPDVRHRHALIRYSPSWGSFTVTLGVHVFEVWLHIKRKPKVHVVMGDLLDAAAKAAEIIHAPRKS